ncbi:dihydrofolate synthetase [Aristolochia californica]|uniref:dihydrofolate synthetase n=1 Tax=Aristolochia californica TaxID=171875 RepID=UPI0035E3AF61
MHRLLPVLHQGSNNFMKVIPRCEKLLASLTFSKLVLQCRFSTDSADPKLKELLDYLENLKNHEKYGVPKGAGTDSDEGFDLGRMKRLMERLGDPQSKFKAVHIAGTKGKGSTAAFLCNILREEGYSVGCYSSPHVLTIRERIALGKKGDPISPKVLTNLFHQVKGVLDQSIKLENGSLTHFEVFTALAFSIFAQENVDVAIIEAGLGGARDATNVLSCSEVVLSIITTIGLEHLAALGGSLESIAKAKSGIIKHARPVVIGGPFEPRIESILRDKASLLGSPVISASDSRIQSVVKGIHQQCEELSQSCDLVIQIEEDLKMFIELNNVRLRMLGRHQLQNAVTATCTALCLRELGWRVSDESIHAGLQKTYLPGRSQFLTGNEAGVLGLPEGLSVLIDGAHTEASAKGLADTIRMAYPKGPVALVVAMASDKDHLAFAREMLSGTQPEVVLLTEASVVGSRSRVTPASSLKEVWVQAASELGIRTLDSVEKGQEKQASHGRYSISTGSSEHKIVLRTCCPTESAKDTLVLASELLRSQAQDESGLVVVTGSLHIVSLVLTMLHG